MQERSKLLRHRITVVYGKSSRAADGWNWMARLIWRRVRLWQDKVPLSALAMARPVLKAEERRRIGRRWVPVTVTIEPRGPGYWAWSIHAKGELRLTLGGAASVMAARRQADAAAGALDRPYPEDEPSTVYADVKQSPAPEWTLMLMRHAHLV